MRQLYFFPTVILVFVISCAPEPKEQGQPEKFPVLTGRTFIQEYYPDTVDSLDAENLIVAASLAHRMNMNFTKVTFVTDSTYITRSTKYVTQGEWRIMGDSILYEGNTYPLMVIGDGIFIQWRPGIMMEFTPL